MGATSTLRPSPRDCDLHKDLRVVPVAPHSQALNRAENTWGRIHGHSFLCSRRARLGPRAWSIVERGAVYIHNHTPAPHALDPASHRCSRWEALTLEPTDTSTMLGFVGQMGYTHRVDGKANAQRTTSDPVLYVCPATALHAQIVFNLASFKLMVVGSVHLSVRPMACSYILASSALHRPYGLLGTPTDDDYAARLNELVTWRPLAGVDVGTAVVEHDPLHGLPTAIYNLTPALGPDGNLLMLEPSDLDAPMGADPAAAAVPDDAQEGPGAGAALVPAAAAAPFLGGVGLPMGDDTWVPAYCRRSADDARNLVAAACLAGPDWPLRFKPSGKKSGKSKVRFDAYRGSQTLGAYRTAHVGGPDGVAWRTELINDVRTGLADIRPVAPAVHVAVVRAHLLSRSVRGRRRPGRFAPPPHAGAGTGLAHPWPQPWRSRAADPDGGVLACAPRLVGAH